MLPNPKKSKESDFLNITVDVVIKYSMNNVWTIIIQHITFFL